MAATAYYKRSADGRSRRPIVTPMSPDVLDRLRPMTDRSVSHHLRRSRPATSAAPGSSVDRHESSTSSGSASRPREENGMSHAKLYYNPAREQIYKRFSLQDWDLSNAKIYNFSEKERIQAERLRTDAWRSVKLTDQKTRLRQLEATKKLKDRATLIGFWKEQLVKEARLNQNETEVLQEHLRVLTLALENAKKPLEVAEQCLTQREKRFGIDQVKDDVERSLIKEVGLIQSCRQKMKDLTRKAVIQIRMNQAAQQEIDKDVKDKNHAHHLDDKMYQMKNSTPGIGFHPGMEVYDNTISVPDSWMKFSEENIARSMKCRGASEKLRGEIDALLRVCANDMWNQFNTVNNAFTHRINELTDTRNHLQGHLKRTNQELFDVEKTIHLLKKGIADKEAPLKVAQTRLNERTNRNNVELCNDSAMKILQREVKEIQDSIRNLQDELRSAEGAWARLHKTKTLLEADIRMKENSLSIDQTGCLGMRRAFPLDSKSGPIYTMPLTY